MKLACFQCFFAPKPWGKIRRASRQAWEEHIESAWAKLGGWKNRHVVFEIFFFWRCAFSFFVPGNFDFRLAAWPGVKSGPEKSSSLRAFIMFVGDIYLRDDRHEQFVSQNGKQCEQKIRPTPSLFFESYACRLIFVVDGVRWSK